MAENKLKVGDLVNGPDGKSGAITEIRTSGELSRHALVDHGQGSIPRQSWIPVKDLTAA